MSSVSRKSLARHVDQLIQDYQEMHMHASDVDVLAAPPTPLEALRMIHKSRPTLIEGFNAINPSIGNRDWSTAETYEKILGDKEVTIAITDDGLADSVRTLPDGGTMFVKPLEEKMSAPGFLTRLRDPNDPEALYLQSQDGNIYRHPPHPEHHPELAAFQPFIQPEVSWMQDALASRAEAVNLWIGSGRSVTSFHHDPFENIYHVLSGTKTFTLVSPIEGLLFDQRFHPPSTLHRTPSGQLRPLPDSTPSHPVPWVSSSDPPPSAHALTITIRAGQTLYLPSGWWHRVEQSPGEGGLAVAVNYWYPSEVDNQLYAHERLARRIARKAGMSGVIPVAGDSDEDEEDVGVNAEDGEADIDGVWGSDVDSGQEWEPSDWGR